MQSIQITPYENVKSLKGIVILSANRARPFLPHTVFLHPHLHVSRHRKAQQILDTVQCKKRQTTKWSSSNMYNGRSSTNYIPWVVQRSRSVESSENPIWSCQYELQVHTRTHAHTCSSEYRAVHDDIKSERKTGRVLKCEVHIDRTH